MTADRSPAAGVYGGLVEERGLGGSHHRLLAEVRRGAKVLDVGCASGYLGGPLTESGCTVVGFERDPRAAAIARGRCACVVIGDFASEADRAVLPRDFDFVLMGDVLEHLADPWAALRAVHDLLAPGGRALVSLPNVAAWPVRLALLRGRFEYVEFGILDRTHLRFFTRESAHALARDAGFMVEHEHLVHLEREPGLLRRALPRLTHVVDRGLVRASPGLFAQQFVLRLRPLP